MDKDSEKKTSMNMKIRLDQGQEIFEQDLDAMQKAIDEEQQDRELEKTGKIKWVWKLVDGRPERVKEYI